MGTYDAIISRIREDALTVLEQKGIKIENADVRQTLSGVPGITVKANRAYFAPDYTEAFLAGYLAKNEYHEATRFTTGCLGHAGYIYDWDDQLRPLTEADNNEMARLIDALRPEGITGSAPGIPQDVPAPLQSISQFISGAKNSRSGPGGSGFKSLANDLLIMECEKVLDIPHWIGVHPISPLNFGGNEVEIGLELHKRFPDLPVSIGSMPTVGLSTPASIVAGFTVAVAEIVGAGMVFDALGTEELSLSVNLYPFDMRYMSFIYGTPANIAINKLETEINRTLLHANIVSKSLRTMSQRPDSQAASQKALYAGIMAEYGKRNFVGAGSLSLDEEFSPVQLMVDREIMSSLKKTYEITETCFDEEHLLLDVILENEDGDFITDESTLDYFRDNQWDSPLFAAYQLQQFVSAGSPELYANAKEIARKLIRENTYELAADKALELDKLYDWARAHIDDLKK